MHWPWERTTDRLDEPLDVEVEARTSELEERAESVARRLRAQDPWAGRILDAIHTNLGRPHVQ